MSESQVKELTAADYNLTQAAYSVDAFAAATGLGRNSIYKAAKSGELRIVKIGRCSRIVTPDAVAFLNSLQKLG
jgi:hypothetical protein